MGGAQGGRRIRQNGCPAGSAYTSPPRLVAPSASTRGPASAGSSTITSGCHCCGTAGSGQVGGVLPGARWNARPELASLTATTLKSALSYVTGRPSTADQNLASFAGS